MTEQASTHLPRLPDLEYHDGDPVCVGQWCCGCSIHPAGKPWGWNNEAWDRHFARVHPSLVAPRERQVDD